MEKDEMHYLVNLFHKTLVFLFSDMAKMYFYGSQTLFITQVAAGYSSKSLYLPELSMLGQKDVLEPRTFSPGISMTAESPCDVL